VEPSEIQQGKGKGAVLTVIGEKKQDNEKILCPRKKRNGRVPRALRGREMGKPSTRNKRARGRSRAGGRGKKRKKPGTGPTRRKGKRPHRPEGVKKQKTGGDSEREKDTGISKKILQ